MRLSVALAAVGVAAAALLGGGWHWLVQQPAPAVALSPVNAASAASAATYDWGRLPGGGAGAGLLRPLADDGDDAGDAAAAETVRPVRIQVPDSVLEDLKARLERARLPAPQPGVRWHNGVDHATLQRLIQVWRHDYDWRAHEARLNRWQHYLTSIDGLDTHFVHLRADRTRASTVYPLLLVHGWPGSIVEFLAVADRLTEPTPVPGSENERFAFDVVMPSLPGYGFTDAPLKAGMGAVEIAAHFHKLMDRLGYHRYFYQGGDWGAVIGKAVSPPPVGRGYGMCAHGRADERGLATATNNDQFAQMRPDQVLGLHVNMFPAPSFPGQHPLVAAVRLAIAAINPSWVLADPKEQAKALPLSRILGRMFMESGYMHEQATRPDTLGVGLNDSPVGLAAWILEKFYAWSDARDGNVFTQFEPEAILTNVMLYWVTGSITSSMRLYRETLLSATEQEKSARGVVPVPVGLLCSPVNTLGFECMPRDWTSYMYPDLVQYTDLEHGGHFAAMERESSDALVADVRLFAIKVLARVRPAS